MFYRGLTMHSQCAQKSPAQLFVSSILGGALLSYGGMMMIMANGGSGMPKVLFL